MAKAKILVVEDESIVAKDIEKRLKSLGYAVPAVVSSGEEAIKKTAQTHPDLVLMDIKIKGDVDGVEAATQIRARFNIPVVYLTAYSDEKTLERAKITEPLGYILKPFEERELHTAIEIALYKHKMEKKLKECQQWLTTTLKSIGDAVIATDTKGLVTFINRVASALTGWKQKAAFGKNLTEVFNIIDEETRPLTESLVTKVLREGVFVALENHTLIAKDGTETPIDVSSAPIRDEEENITGVVLVFRDITERKRAEEKIKSSLKEKEVLLKEIHHRVKNNLQVISSMLHLQSGYIKDKQALEMFRESQNRVKLMVLIHEKLYQSKDLARIDFAEYIRDLVAHLFRSYGVDSEVIALKINVEDVILGIDTAIPCGLIINELVSNSLKHAFPAGKKGEICIDLRSDNNNKFTLTVSDNGIGFPRDLDFRKTETLGLQLVITLVEQLGGTIELYRNGGTEFKIKFTA